MCEIDSWGWGTGDAGGDGAEEDDTEAGVEPGDMVLACVGLECPLPPLPGLQT